MKRSKKPSNNVRLNALPNELNPTNAVAVKNVAKAVHMAETLAGSRRAVKVNNDPARANVLGNKAVKAISRATNPATSLELGQAVDAVVPVGKVADKAVVMAEDAASSAVDLAAVVIVMADAIDPASRSL